MNTKPKTLLMKKLPLLIALTAGILVTSCSKKAPDFVNSIPDQSVIVMSMHPRQIFDKGQISSLEQLKEDVDDEFMRSIIENPKKSGIMLNEYAFGFVYMKNENPVIGFVAGLSNSNDFETMLKTLDEEDELEITTSNGFSQTVVDKELSIAWDNEKTLLLGSPDMSMSKEEWAEETSTLFNLSKENAITSLVNFKEFTGKMKDLNFWVSSDELQELMKSTDAMEDMDMQLPMELANNYGQVFCEFSDGAVYVHSESSFSEEMEKTVGEFMVMKPELNPALLEITPGNDLLMAVAGSFDIEKLQKLMTRYAPDQVSGVGPQLEQITGMGSDSIWNAFTGDFVIAVNGAGEGGMIPIEAFIGLGLKDETLQKNLMGTVEGMVPVEEEGDFFVINTNGMEIYSGITQNIWVITNARGYKAALSEGGLEATLNDSEFKEYAGGSMAMYLNLDMTTYPSQLQQMMSQNPGQREMFEAVSSSFRSLGMEARQNESDMTLITSKSDENSLYTIMQLTEKAE